MERITFAAAHSLASERHSNQSVGMSRTRPRYVLTAHPLSPVMDEESWFISLSTAIGGFVGWLNARSQVDDMCQVSVNSPQDPINMCVPGLNGWGGTISADEAQGRLAEYTDMVYPSSILSGSHSVFWLEPCWWVRGNSDVPRAELESRSSTSMTNEPPWACIDSGATHSLPFASS